MTDRIKKTTNVDDPAHCLAHGECMLSLFNHVQLFATPWTVTHHTPLSMGFSRQEYWSRLPRPLSGNLPNTEIKPRSPAMQADSLLPEPPGKPKKTGVGSLSFWRWSSQPRNWTGVSCIAGGFFTSWATREAHCFYSISFSGFWLYLLNFYFIVVRTHNTKSTLLIAF